VQRAGDRLKVIVQLNRTDTGYHLWSTVFEASAGDLLRVQSDIAQKVAQTLTPALTNVTQVAAPPPATDFRALDAYARGLYALRTGVPAQYDNAVALAREAIAIDPQFARGWALLGVALAWREQSRGAVTAAARDASVAALEKAIALDPHMAYLDANLGGWAMLYDYDWPRAERLYRDAIAAAPSNANGYSGYAGGLLLRGRFDEADAMYAKALDLDPLGISHHVFRALVPYYAGRYDEAVQRLEEVHAMAPADATVLLGLVSAHLARDDIPAARARMNELARMLPGSPLLELAEGSFACKGGDVAGGLAHVRHAEAPVAALQPFSVGAVYAACKDATDAVRLLLRAREMHDPMFAYLAVEPLLDPIRDDPQFHAVWNAAPALVEGIVYPRAHGLMAAAR
jgi:serine/threonine-protein kinase